MYKIRMKDLPEDARPQEKLLAYGPTSLSNAELIALIIRTGTKENNSISLAQKLLEKGNDNDNKGASRKLEYFGLKFLANATLEEITEVKGIGKSKAAMILAAIELAKRISKSSVDLKKLNTTDKLPYMVMDDMRNLEKEHFKIAILNTKKELSYLETITVGSIDKTIVEPREVFSIAIKRNAHTLILLHNHPSGDPKPSVQDIEITKTLKEAGSLLNIPVIDHIIIGDGRYFSFLEEGIF